MKARQEKGSGVLCREPLPAVPIRYVASWTDSSKQALLEIDHSTEKDVF